MIDTQDPSVQASVLNQATVSHKKAPARLKWVKIHIWISGYLVDWPEHRNMARAAGALYHSQAQSKIARRRYTVKNRILLINYYSPGDLKQQIDTIIDHSSLRRHDESLQNPTPYVV